MRSSIDFYSTGHVSLFIMDFNISLYNSEVIHCSLKYLARAVVYVMYACVYMYCTCMYACVCMYVYVAVCMCWSCDRHGKVKRKYTIVLKEEYLNNGAGYLNSENGFRINIQKYPRIAQKCRSGKFHRQNFLLLYLLNRTSIFIWHRIGNQRRNLPPGGFRTPRPDSSTIKAKVLRRPGPRHSAAHSVYPSSV